MTISLRRAIAALAAVLVAGTACTGGGGDRGPAPGAQSGRPLSATLTAPLDRAIDAAMKSAGVPGALVGIWSPDGDYVRAFGVADTATGTPMKTDFYSRIGSVTKTFTATALLQLVKQGRVGLGDPIAKYLDGVPGGESTTVRQLADMRSGLPDYAETEGFADAVQADPTRDFTPQQLLGWAFTEPRDFPPGGGWKYSNTNYVILGLLIEKVSGQQLGDYFTEHIFGPLNMAHTSYPTGTQFPDPHAQGYTDPLKPGGPPQIATGWNASMTGAAGAIISTLDDMRRWAPALATGTLLDPELQEQRLRNAAGTESGSGIGYGIGVLTAAGWIGHNGSVPGYQSVVVYLPQRQTTLVVMLNSDIGQEGSPMPSSALAKAITSVVTPNNIYDV